MGEIREKKLNKKIVRKSWKRSWQVLSFIRYNQWKYKIYRKSIKIRLKSRNKWLQ